MSSFRTWRGIPPHELFPKVSIQAIGGEQLLLCRVTYGPGAVVPSHSHPQTEQVMIILEGSITITIDEETASLGPGDLAVINRGVPHELTSPEGCVFIEGLAPVPRDHVPDPSRDLVLGEQGDRLHVER